MVEGWLAGAPVHFLPDYRVGGLDAGSLLHLGLGGRVLVLQARNREAKGLLRRVIPLSNDQTRVSPTAAAQQARDNQDSEAGHSFVVGQMHGHFLTQQPDKLISHAPYPSILAAAEQPIFSEFS
jgi:hypothetical protein